jgi:hypothetical protein
MKKLILFLLLAITIGANAQTPYTIPKQLQLLTVPLGVKSDSIVVIRANGKTYMMPRSRITSPTPSLQEVTDVGNTTSNNIVLNGNKRSIMISNSGDERATLGDTATEGYLRLAKADGGANNVLKIHPNTTNGESVYYFPDSGEDDVIKTLSTTDDITLQKALEANPEAALNSGEAVILGLYKGDPATRISYPYDNEVSAGISQLWIDQSGIRLKNNYHTTSENRHATISLNNGIFQLQSYNTLFRFAHETNPNYPPSAIEIPSKPLGGTFTLATTSDFKTINGNSIVGSGDIVISASNVPVSATVTGIIDNTSLQELGGVDKLINGVRVGQGNILNAESTAVGISALSNDTGGYNSAFGNSALKFNTTGNANNGFGDLALSNNTTGSSNNAFGYKALFANTTAASNDAFGAYALSNNTSGNQNVAVGKNSMFSNLSSSFNVAIGTQALKLMTAGLGQSVAIGAYCMSDATSTDKNAGIGTYALRYNTSGYSNTATGHTALGANTSGHSNTANGNYSLKAVTTGFGNIGIGKFAGEIVTTGNGNIYIGSGGNVVDATADGVINIGNKIISNSTNLVIIPSQTNALITADATGKSVVTKEYLDTRIGSVAPASASATGTVGEIRVTSEYIYWCIAPNTWIRAVGATF